MRNVISSKEGSADSFVKPRIFPILIALPKFFCNKLQIQDCVYNKLIDCSFSILLQTTLKHVHKASFLKRSYKSVLE